jgi:hypothetical protein
MADDLIELRITWRYQPTGDGILKAMLREVCSMNLNGFRLHHKTRSDRVIGDRLRECS